MKRQKSKPTKKLDQELSRAPDLTPDMHDNEPVITLIFPELGYVDYNVRILSARAARVAGDSTVQELRRVADCIEFDEALVKSHLASECSCLEGKPCWKETLPFPTN
jgi:hypothetical protein